MESSMRNSPRALTRADPPHSDPNIFAVGDAIEVQNCVLYGKELIPLAGPANKQARLAANNAIAQLCAHSNGHCNILHRLMHALQAPREGRQSHAPGLPLRPWHLYRTGIRQGIRHDRQQREGTCSLQDSPLQQGARHFCLPHYRTLLLIALVCLLMASPVLRTYAEPRFLLP